MPKTKTNFVRGDFGQPENTDGFWWEQFKIIQNYKRNDNSNKMQLNNADSSNYIQSKGIGNKKYYEETRELEK